MGITLQGLGVFCRDVASLQSFPLCCAYIIVVLLSGVWQKLTRPVTLRPLLIVYNFACGVISVYTAYGFISVLASIDLPLHAGWIGLTVKPLRFFMRLYWYTKMLELLDTVFMILRHRSRQVSFLHVYHHSTMLLLTDFVFGITGYFYYNFCGYSLLYLMTMTYLFASFYYNVYVKERAAARQLDGFLKQRFSNNNMLNGYKNDTSSNSNGAIINGKISKSKSS